MPTMPSRWLSVDTIPQERWMSLLDHISESHAILRGHSEASRR